MIANFVSILVADDSALARKQIVDILKDFGEPTIYQAKDGVEAWEIIEDNKVDLVFADIVMPRMDGLALLDKINESGKDIKTVVVSSVATSSNLVSAIKKGAIEVIQKPYAEEQILQVLRNVIG